MALSEEPTSSEPEAGCHILSQDNLSQSRLANRAPRQTGTDSGHLIAIVAGPGFHGRPWNLCGLDHTAVGTFCPSRVLAT